jgi:hypothetical protein
VGCNQSTCHPHELYNENSSDTVLGDIDTLSIHCLHFLTHGMARLRLAAQQAARVRQRMREYLPDRLDEHEWNSLDIESPSDSRLLPRKRDGEKGGTFFFFWPLKRENLPRRRPPVPKTAPPRHGREYFSA